jgi:putative endonuclease
MSKSYYVYILASNKNGTLYVGITSTLARRICEHKEKIIKGFTSKYSVDKLVYAEECGDVKEAIAYEKRLKKWNRHWKINLIEKNNPNWDDLYEDIY